MSIYKEFPTAEILQDIRDTEDEIKIMEREKTGLRMQSDRMSHFRADARESGIAERKVFIAKLRNILEERKDPSDKGSEGEK